jgi:hypothetical protein
MDPLKPLYDERAIPIIEELAAISAEERRIAEEIVSYLKAGRRDFVGLADALEELGARRAIANERLKQYRTEDKNPPNSD